MKTEQLRGEIKQAAERADNQNTEDMGSWKHFKELLVGEILQACKGVGLKFVPDTFEIPEDAKGHAYTKEFYNRAINSQIEEIDV